VAPDGQPVTVATWYLLEDDGTILLGLDSSRARLAHLRHEPRISLTILVEGNWYSHISVQGSIGPIVDDEGLAQIDRLSTHYLGSPYGNRTSPRVYTHVTPEHWHGWENGKALR
jgi:PPOX class probable F420-dependent enzyme